MFLPGFIPLKALVVVPDQTSIIPAASRSNCFSIPFCKPFPTPRRITNIKMPDATESPVRNVLSLFLAIASNISCQRSMLNIRRGSYLFYKFIVDNYSVFQNHVSFTHCSNIRFVRHNQNGFSLIIYSLNQFHNFIRS